MNTNQINQKLVFVIVTVIVLAIAGAAAIYVLGLNKNPGQVVNMNSYSTASSTSSELSFENIGAEDTVNSLDAHLNSQLSSEESIQQLDLEAEFGL